MPSKLPEKSTSSAPSPPKSPPKKRSRCRKTITLGILPKKPLTLVIRGYKVVVWGKKPNGLYRASIHLPGRRAGRREYEIPESDVEEGLNERARVTLLATLAR